MTYGTLGRLLATILRHGAEIEGLYPDAEGFVDLADLLSLKQMRNYTMDDVFKTLDTDNKMRFEAACVDDRWQIRAIQGHTLSVVDDQLSPVRELSELPTHSGEFDGTVEILHPFHRTTVEQWDRVRHGGLSRCARKYVVFAYGQPLDNSVFIYLDVVRAYSDGLPLYQSNGLLFCGGDSRGRIDPCYFSAVDIHGQRLFKNY